MQAHGCTIALGAKKRGLKKQLHNAIKLGNASCAAYAVMPGLWSHTHMCKFTLAFGHEPPVHCGKGRYLPSLLARDTAQFKAFPNHCLCVGVHFHTRPMAEPSYRKNKTFSDRKTDTTALLHKALY